MKINFEAVFINPIGAHKELTEDGWEFDSPVRISNKLGEHLVEEFGLEFEEEYSGIRKYTGENLSMSMFLDEDGGIENIYLQVSPEALMMVKGVCQGPAVCVEAEIFIPKESG